MITKIGFEPFEGLILDVNKKSERRYYKKLEFGRYEIQIVMPMDIYNSYHNHAFPTFIIKQTLYELEARVLEEKFIF